MDSPGVSVQPAQSAAQPAAGVGYPAGTHAAGAGRLLVRVGVVAGQRGPLGTRPGPAATRQDADACSARAAGRRRPIWSWRSPSSGRSANGSGFRSRCPSWRSRSPSAANSPAACELYEQAVAVVTEVGATEDVIRLRTRQALLYWLKGDQDASAAAIAEAERSANGVTWPYALVELALAKAELARWGGDAEEARRQLGVATTFLGDDAELANIRAELHDVLGYLADDLGAGPYPPRRGLAGGVRGGARTPDRPGDRRGRGPGRSPRPVRAGGAAARGQRRRTRTAGSLPAGRGQDRAGGAASPRRGTVRRGDAGGYADELV